MVSNLLLRAKSGFGFVSNYLLCMLPSSIRILGGALFAALAFFAIRGEYLRAQIPSFSDAPVFQEDQEKRLEIERQISELERQAQDLDLIITDARAEAAGVENEKKTIDAEVRRRELEIRRLNLDISKAALDVKKTESEIGRLTGKIETSREGLIQSLRTIHLNDRENPLLILLKYRNLSAFFSSVEEMLTLQHGIRQILAEFEEDRWHLEEKRQSLEEEGREQQDLKALQEVERRFLAKKQSEKETLLRAAKGKEAVFEQLLSAKQRDIAALKNQLYYLGQTGLKVEDALTLAQRAASRAGIRTAFLLALLEVETGKQFEDGALSVGANLGTGNWQKDLYRCYINLGKRSTADSEKRAFFEITSSLGLNPDEMPVSKKPRYGCGGAMGPAQFLPTTWLRFAPRVSELTGHNPPNPWNTEDAFTASALLLADAGAALKTDAGERAAAKAYISGNPRCARSVCNHYSNRILALSREIDRVL